MDTDFSDDIQINFNEQPTNKFLYNKKSIYRRENFEWPKYKFVQREMNLVPGPPVMLYGDAGTSKTALCSYLALCVATGEPFFGLEVVKGRVLHLDYEQSEELVESKYYRLMNGHEFNPEEGTLDFARPQIPVNVEGGEQELQDAVQGYDLVILDCFRACFEGEENDSQSTESALNILSRVSLATKAVFLVIHHTGKAGQTGNGTHGRGSSRIGQKASTTFTIEQKKQGAEFYYTLSMGKKRISHWDGVSYKFIDSGDFIKEINQTEAVNVVKIDCTGPNLLRGRILEILGMGEKNGSDLAKEIGGSKEKYLDELKELMNEQLVKMVKQGNKHIYSLTTKEERFEEENQFAAK